MELANLEQLTCCRCGEEIFDGPDGFVHHDGSDVFDCDETT